LGNLELYFSLHDLLEQNVSVSAFCELFTGSETDVSFSETAIAFLASHFDELPQSFLSGLPISVLSRILEHPSLTLKSEDALYEFVISQFDLRPDSIGILALIRFEFLTTSTTAKFGMWSCDHFESLDFSLPLWRAILNRLSQTANIAVPKSTRYRKVVRVEFRAEPREGSPLDGIIAALTRTAGGNVFDRGIVDVSASSVNGNLVARNAVDLGQQNYFRSENQPNQWLRYDFKDRRIRLTD
jgi:hypothetical protein